jgi:ribonuclease HI
MYIVQQNCQKGYEHTIAALESALEIGAGVVCIQEPFIGKKVLIHSAFNLYWPSGCRKDLRVMTAVRRDILNRVVVESRSDIVNHPYCLTLDIQELSTRNGSGRRTRVVNVYDNIVGRGRTWEGPTERVRRAIEDMNWGVLMRGRVLVVGDMNAHSPRWNPASMQGHPSAKVLEELVDKYQLIINNQLGTYTRKASKAVLDLALTTIEMGPLTTWEIPEGYPSLSDHELIVLEWADLNIGVDLLNQGQVTGWDIQSLSADCKKLKEAETYWQEQSARRGQLPEKCTVMELEQEVEWIETALTMTLNKFARTIRVTPYSKRWWNEEVKETRKEYSRAKREWGGNRVYDEELRETRNRYYRTIRKAKRECWQKFLQGETDLASREYVSNEETKRCWTALKYTNPRPQSVTPALKRHDGTEAVTMTEKEVLITETLFPEPPGSRNIRPRSLTPGNAHIKIQDISIKQALFSQAITKVPGPDQLTFRTLRLLWNWEARRIEQLVRHCIRLQHHPARWKEAKGILLAKPGKLPEVYHTPKGYRVICLLNCLGKVVEKVVADELSITCETASLLHIGQMGSRKRRCAVDAVAIMVHHVQKAWDSKRLAGALLMDVKGAFDHVDCEKLVRRMRTLRLDEDLIGWTQSFLSDRQVALVIDGFLNPKRKIRSGIPQGSPVSPILFLIYLSALFAEVEARIPAVMSLCFVDDLAFIAEGGSADNIAETLEVVADIAARWGLLNSVSYDMSKTEAVLFTRARLARRRKMIQDTSIQIGANQVKFNENATRWLGIWLDAGLTFSYHQKYRMSRAKAAEARLKGITNSFGLAPGLVRRIQIAAVQATALYGAELWWRDQKTHLEDIQKLVNRQARAVTGAFRSTPTGPLVREAGLTPAKILLDSRQRNYACRLLSLPDRNPAKDILPVSLVTGDGSAQPGDHPEGDIDWSVGRGPTWLGHHLARRIAMGHSIDPAEGVEPIVEIRPQYFPGNICIDDTATALKLAKQKSTRGLTLWSDGSRLDHGGTGAGVAWKSNGEWLTSRTNLGKNKEIFDAELWGVSDALGIALTEAQPNDPVTVYLDSQAAIKKIQYSTSQSGQAIALQCHKRAAILSQRQNPVTIRWVPGHLGVEGNERADKAAKQAASGQGRSTAKWSSLAHVQRIITETASKEAKEWLKAKLQVLQAKGGHYTPCVRQGINGTLAKAPKLLAARYYQLKTGHASVGIYLKRINATETDDCWWCGAAAQDAKHLWADCREWRSERRVLKRALEKVGVAWPVPATRAEIANLLSNDKATGMLLEFLDSTEAGLRDGAVERIREWGEKRDREGEEEVEAPD